MGRKKISEADVNIVFNNEYFKVAKMFQFHAGLWPFHSGYSKKSRQLIIFICILLIYYPLGYGTLYYWDDNNLNLFFENLLGFCLAVAVSVKYFASLIAEKQLKILYKELSCNWLLLKDPEERKILKKFTQRGKYIGMCFIFYFIGSYIGFTFLPAMPIALDVIYPLNQSRDKILIANAKYPVDPDKHYYLVHLYLMVCITSGLLIFAGIDPMFLAITHHFLGITSIVKYRLFHATSETDPSDDKSYDLLVQAIRLHQKSLKFIDEFRKSYRNVLFFHIIITVLITSISAAAVTILADILTLFDYFRIVSLSGGTLMHAFYISWCGQQIYDYSASLFISTYDNEWYNIPKKSKKLLQIMMMRCIRPCNLTTGGVTNIDYYIFGEILRNTVSYMTIIISMKETS